MHQRLKTIYKTLGGLACSFPIFCFAGGKAAHEHAIRSLSISESSATAEDSVYPGINVQGFKDLELSEAMRQALNKYFPGLILWRISDYPAAQLKGYPYEEKSLPYVVMGDFNGDGIEDAAIAGHNRESNLVLALISSGSASYRVLEVKEEKFYTGTLKDVNMLPSPTDALVLKKKGTKIIEGDIGPTMTILKSDGFSVKGISTFDRSTHGFRLACTGINTYEYKSDFSSTYLGKVSTSTTSVPKQGTVEYFKGPTIPDEMLGALRSYDKDFVLWRAQDYPEREIAYYSYMGRSFPSHISYDFNGDGKNDMVLSGHDADSNITFALISASSSYYSMEINRFPCYKLARKHNKMLPYVPTDILEPGAKGGFLLRQINTWTLEDPEDDYSDDYKLTGRSGQTIAYNYVEKFFKYDGPEDECVNKGGGTPW